MKKSDTARLKLSSIRQDLNKHLEAGVTDENRAEVEKLSKGLENAEVEYRAAIQAEAEEDKKQPGTDEHRSVQDGEERERQRLIQRSSLGAFFKEALTGKEVSGAELEMRSAVLGDGAAQGKVPFAILDPGPERRRVEDRADVVTSLDAADITTGSRASVLERIFTNSIAAGLGVSMPSVPVGEASYPVMTAGTAASMVAAEGAIEAAEAQFTLTNIGPTRLSARYRLRVEDMASFPALEETLRSDLRMAMTDAMDNQVINGNGAAPNVSGLFNALAAPTAASGVVAFGNFIDTFAGFVDGITSYGLGDIAGVIGPTTYARAASAFANSGKGDVSAAEYIRGRAGGLRVSSRMPAVASKKQEGILARTSYPGTNAVAPVWEAFELIRDPYTNAATGIVNLTAIMLWNFKVLRTGAWKRVEFQVAA